MDVILIPLVNLINTVLWLYMWAVIIGAVLSWLVAFNVINTRNRLVYMTMETLYRITDPALRPIRRALGRVLPDMGGVDISPVILILILIFIQDVLRRVVFSIAT